MQLFRNQQNISGVAAVSTLGSSNREGNKRNENNNGAAFISPSAQEANLQPAFFKPRCVIFDKDGTLVCFHTMWSPWCTDLAER